jgi:hypothetical protein
MGRENRTSRLVFATLFVFTVACSANAYVDSGTGSMLIQILIAGSLGAVFAVKSFWARIVSGVFGRSAAKKQETVKSPDA